MRKKTALITIFILSLFSSTQAQKWKLYRHEAYLGIGPTGMYSELGGGRTEARDLFLDFNTKATRFAGAGGYRFKINELFSAKASLTYARLYGSDSFSKDIYRKSRNISVTTSLLEISAVGEFYFIKEKTYNRYRLRGLKGGISSSLSAYILGGLGGFYFNPTAVYNGTRYSLQPLGTEGQGIYPNTKKYSRINACIPIGIGTKLTLTENISLSLEYNLRYTLTDYLDDTSGSYADPTDVANANGGLNTEKGQAAYYFAHPSINVNDFFAGGSSPKGQQRGDMTSNDVYMFAIIGINYKFSSKNTNKPKF